MNKHERATLDALKAIPRATLESWLRLRDHGFTLAVMPSSTLVARWGGARKQESGMTLRVREVGALDGYVLPGRTMDQGILEHFAPAGSPIRMDLCNWGYRWDWASAAGPLARCKGETTLDLEDPTQWEWETEHECEEPD